MRYLVAGGAGFIGSHVVCELCRREPDAQVVVFDNFSSGRRWHLERPELAGRLRIIQGDIKDLPALKAALEGCDHVFHFASNPDISKALTQPDIDFWEGTFLTQNVVEAMRQAGVGRLTYASGSGIYGDLGLKVVAEDHGPLLPSSTYGASKLAGEALICSYVHMFGLRAHAFRFANVVGPHQTHGVAYDFILRLLRDPTRLRILGDGQQSKSYIYVDDVVSAMLLLAQSKEPGFEYFNVATEDHIRVCEIADLVVERLGLRGVQYEFTGGDRGWKGDVPVVRLSSEKLRARGWRNQRTCRQAMLDSTDSMIADARAGKL